MSLTKKTKSAISWSLLERFSSQGITFGIQILLARLIDPSEFSLLIIVTVFMLFSNLVIDGGFGQALIQKDAATRTDISTVFVFNLFIGILLYVLLFVSSPAIAGFYGQPRLTLLIRVMSISLIIQSLGLVHARMLIRNLAFKKLFLISTPSIIIGGVVGVGLALAGFGVWALVYSRIAISLVATISYWWLSGQDTRPRFEFSISSFRSMGRFGLGVLGVTFVHQGMQNIYGLVIGKYFMFDQLAFYNRARLFHRTPATTITSILNRVLFPIFSTIKDDNTRIRSAIRRGVPVVAFTVFPAMIFLMAAADHVIVVLLTAKWLPSAEFMRWFPVIGMITPIAAVQLSVIRAKGRSGLLLILSILKNGIAMTVLLITIHHGILAIVIGQVAVALGLHLLVNMPTSHYVFGYRWLDQISDVIPYVFASVFAGACSLGIVALVAGQSHFVLLITQATVMATTYFIVCHWGKLDGFREFLLHASALSKKLFPKQSP